MPRPRSGARAGLPGPVRDPPRPRARPLRPAALAGELERRQVDDAPVDHERLAHEPRPVEPDVLALAHGLRRPRSVRRRPGPRTRPPVRRPAGRWTARAPRWRRAHSSRPAVRGSSRRSRASRTSRARPGARRWRRPRPPGGGWPGRPSGTRGCRRARACTRRSWPPTERRPGRAWPSSRPTARPRPGRSGASPTPAWTCSPTPSSRPGPWRTSSGPRSRTRRTGSASGRARRRRPG